MENYKTSKIPIKNHTDASKEKTNMTPLSTGSIHGVKLSMNMSSKAKRDFLMKLEEWRKKKREKFIEKTNAEKKGNENSKIKAKESFLIKNKPISTTNSIGKKETPSFDNKESVFERLYKNSKGAKCKGNLNIESNKENINRKVENKTPCLKKKNDILKEDFQKTEEPINRGLVMPTNNLELQSHFVENLENIDEKDYNIDDNILSVTNNSPRSTFIVTKETSTTESLISDINLKNEEIISKTDDLMTLNSFGKSTDKSFQENESCSLNKKIEDSQICDVREEEMFHENQEIINNESEAVSVELTNGVSHQSKKSQPNIKIFSGKSLERKNLNFCHSKKNIIELNEKKTKTYLRKSISSVYFQKCGIPPKGTKNIAFEINQPILNSTSCKKEIDKVFLPIKENKNLSGIKGIASATPLHKKNLTSSCLRNKLEDWLTEHNHSLEGYRHLRCFGVTEASNNICQTPVKALKIGCVPKLIESEISNKEDNECNKENLSPANVAEQVEVNLLEDENRLKELFQLIVDLKYDPDKCEDWLVAIRKKNPRVTDLPIYWECLAALNQDNEDIRSAIEQCEKSSVNKEENSPDNSLAQLFDKLVIDQQRPNEHKLEKGIDPKNIFRSTIIKFSLQQKITKESNTKEGEESNTVSKYVATPVRRSSRLWTPRKNYVVNSLQGLSPQIRENVTFKTNDSLLN